MQLSELWPRLQRNIFLESYFGMFLSVPRDVQFKIYSAMSLDTLASLRRVCRQSNLSIANDKQFWAHLIERDVISRRISLHPLRTKLADASASQVESWLRCALQLQHVFSNELEPEILKIKLDLHVTWVKILRTCWCLVASSSLTESRLTVWNLSNGPTISKEYFLSGPVIDGIVEDVGTNIVAALTIGTRRMHVLVISIGVWKDSVSIHISATLSSISHVRMLQGPLIVCAERDGDDTYPSIVNWREKRFGNLIPRWFIDHADLPWGILHCAICAATTWLGHIILVLNKSVEIFRTTDWESGRETDLVAVATIPLVLSEHYGTSPTRLDDVEETLLHTSASFKTEEGYPVLHFSCRSKSGLYSPFSIVFTGPEDTGFAIYRGFLGEGSKRSFPVEANRSAVGTTSNFEVHLRAERGYDSLPSLFFVSMKRGRVERDGKEAYLTAASPKKLTAGFPLLHYTTTLDFDDGIGLLVLGTAKGYLCLVRFLPYWMVAPGSFTDQLPAQHSDQGELSTKMVEMDIPTFYRYYKGSAAENVSERNVIREAMESWPVTHRVRDLRPWSNNWEYFEAAFSWAAPANRWPQNDPEYGICFTAICGVRDSLTTFGDVIPLAYRTDPDVVVFRVGPRLYMRSTYFDVDGDLRLRFGALPNPFFDTILTGDLLEDYRRSDILSNMKNKKCSYAGVSNLLEAISNLHDLLESIDRHLDIFGPILQKTGKDPNSWTPEDLELIYDNFRLLDED